MPALKPLTTKQAAEQLAVSQPTIRRWIDQGRLRAVRLPSGQYRIEQAEVDRLLGRSNHHAPTRTSAPLARG